MEAPASATLYTIDLAKGFTRQIATDENGYPLATWSADGQWIAVIGSRDVTMYKADNPASSFVITDEIPGSSLPPGCWLKRLNAAGRTPTVQLRFPYRSGWP